MAQAMASMASLRGSSQKVLEGSLQLSGGSRLEAPVSLRVAGGGRAGLAFIKAQGQLAETEGQSSRRALLGIFTAGVPRVSFVNRELADAKPFEISSPPPPSGSRRAALRLVAAGISGSVIANSVLAEEKPVKARPPIPSPGNPYGVEENGLWLPGLIPIPTVTNKINNPETGTRSFVQLGVYVANVGPEGSAYRIKQNAFDLLGWGDLLGRNAWSYLVKYLQLKSTIMYFDFDAVITGASDEQKEPLTDLANRLFSNFEKLEGAVKMKDDSMTRSCYDETTVILKEVMDRMARA